MAGRRFRVPLVQKTGIIITGKLQQRISYPRLAFHVGDIINLSHWVLRGQLLSELYKA